MSNIDPEHRPSPARIRAGFALLALAVLLAVAVFSSDAIVRAGLEGSRITVLAHSASGLGPGSAVWVAGRPVGRVLSVSFRPLADVAADARTHAHLVIEAVLDRVAEPVLRADATAEVRPSELLAPVIVAIHPGTGSAPPWNFADTLRTRGPALDPETVFARADTLAEAVRSLETRAAEARDVIAAAQGSWSRFREDPATLAGLRRDLEMLRDLAERDVSRSSLSRLAADSLVGAAVGRVRTRLAGLEPSAADEGSRRSLGTAAAAVDAMGVRLASLVGRIERGEGTAGRALMDTELRRQLDVLRATATALVEELMADPSRWLRVRVY